MRRAKPSSTSRVAAGPYTGRWQPTCRSVVAIHDPFGERVLLDHLRQARVLDLAAGGLWDRARPHEDHPRRAVAAGSVDAARDLADETVVVVGRRGLAPDLGDDVEPLRARPLAVDPHRGGVAHAVHAVDDFLDVGGHDVLAAENDDVLEAARHVEEPFGVDEPEIAGPEPAARHEHLRGGAGVVVIALHDARALDADLAL